jgi:hypothetical protein
VRRRLVFLAALLLTSGCGSTNQPTRSDAPDSGASSLRTLASGPGPQVALVPGASDFEPGVVRYPFLIIDNNGGSVERSRARVWLSRGLEAKPFEEQTAQLEKVGVPGEARGEVSHLYVVHLRVPEPGKYWVLAKPDGGRPIQGLGNLIVRAHTYSPAIGSEAHSSHTPTLRSTHGNLAKLTTRIPPDRGLLRYSVAESLAVHKPFVLVFATPKFCSSRTCGPVVDVVDAVRKRFSRSAIRFIHVEIYRDNDPAKGFNQWVRQWRLPTEPWIFLVGTDGRIKAKFEGSVSVAELGSSVQLYLRVRTSTDRAS